MEYFIHIKNITRGDKSFGCYIISSSEKMVLTKINIIGSDTNLRRDEAKLLLESIDLLPKNCKKVTVVSDSIYIIYSFKSHDRETKEERKPNIQKHNLDLLENIKSKMYKYTVFTTINTLTSNDMIFDAVKTFVDAATDNIITESLEIKSSDNMLSLLNSLVDDPNETVQTPKEIKIKTAPVTQYPIDIPIDHQDTTIENIDYGNDSKPSSVNDVVITPEYQKVFDLIEFGGTFIFVTGNAGTGKSVLIHQIQKKFYRKKIVVCAPTGLAALNIGGATIHSTFGLPARMLDEDYMRKTKIGDDIKSVVKTMDILIIDEISMVRCDLLDAIDIVCRRSMNNDLLFGGKIVIGVGDLFQLPPVVTDEDDVLLKTMGYKTGFFFSAKCIRALNYDIIELKHIYRQKDESFKALLNKLRIGEDIDFVVNKINERYNMPDSGTGVILATTNKVVDETNRIELEKISSQKYQFTAIQTGIFLEDKNSRKPSPEILELKIGAKVMFVQNNAAKGYVNGTLGIVTGVNSDSIIVDAEDGRSIEVTIATWESIEYKFNKDTNSLDVEVNGVYKQYPLILAWAITIHKSQGKTLSKIYLDLGWGAFAPGQLYVALSRIKSFDGLSIKNVIRHKDVIVSSDIINYYSRKNIQ